MKIRWIVPCLLLATGWFATTEALQSRRERQLAALTEPFVGVTNDGTPMSGLCEIRSTGVSTEPVREAAELFLEGLSDKQRDTVRFPIESAEWRDWHTFEC